jgi:hypothetical protein
MSFFKNEVGGESHFVKGAYDKSLFFKM